MPDAGAVDCTAGEGLGATGRGLGTTDAGADRSMSNSTSCALARAPVSVALLPPPSSSVAQPAALPRGVSRGVEASSAKPGLSGEGSPSTSALAAERSTARAGAAALEGKG